MLAQNLLKENIKPEERITKAFRLIICRTPKPEEEKILNAYYANQLTQFKNKTLDASKTVNAGEFPHAEGQDLNEKAALMKTVSTIYNLEEAITRS